MPQEDNLFMCIKTLFVRERILHLCKAMTVLVYQLGLGYGAVAKILAVLGFPVSKISVRD